MNINPEGLNMIYLQVDTMAIDSIHDPFGNKYYKSNNLTEYKYGPHVYNTINKLIKRK